MYVTRKELLKTRVNIAKQMHEYIIKLGDEEIWSVWIMLGIPDEPDEEDFEFFTERDEEWEDLCKLFGKLVGAEGAD